MNTHDATHDRNSAAAELFTKSEAAAFLKSKSAPWTTGGPPRPSRALISGAGFASGVRTSNPSSPPTPSSVHWLHHEAITALTGRSLNLADPVQQRALLELSLARGISVLFLDNLSCLMRGVAENEADEWEKVLDWLLELRRAGISVVIIHHAGRNGQMRGTSRREDAAHWILSLVDATENDSAGAVFKSTFAKNRNARGGCASCPPLIWRLTTEGNRLTVECERHSDVDAFVDLVKAGLTSARDIATELDVTPGTVSKWAKRAEHSGRIRIEGRQYLHTA